jgi:hypothetical protein
LWRKRYPRDHFGNIKAASRIFPVTRRITRKAGCKVVWVRTTRNCILTFRRNVSPSYLGLLVCKLTRNPEDEGGTFVRNVGRNQTARCNNPEDLVPQQSSGGNPKSLFPFVKKISISDYFIFCIYCVSLTYELFSVKNEMIKILLTFGH